MDNSVEHKKYMSNIDSREGKVYTGSIKCMRMLVDILVLAGNI